MHFKGLCSGSQAAEEQDTSPVLGQRPLPMGSQAAEERDTSPAKGQMAPVKSYRLGAGGL